MFALVVGPALACFGFVMQRGKLTHARGLPETEAKNIPETAWGGGGGGGAGGSLICFGHANLSLS